MERVAKHLGSVSARAAPSWGTIGDGSLLTVFPNRSYRPENPALEAL